MEVGTALVDGPGSVGRVTSISHLFHQSMYAPSVIEEK